MSLDALDAAFVRRLATRTSQSVRPSGATGGRPRPATVAQVPAPTPLDAVPVEPLPAAPLPVAPRVAGQRPRLERTAVTPVAERPPVVEPPVVEGGIEEPIVARLLARTPEQWDALAGHVEAARQRGRRVIAVAGGRIGEGRTTLVRCIASRLRSRGRDVACTIPHDLAVVAGGADGRGPTHDKRIVLVDAGIWFPPGPIRRSLLQVASLGCDAAILVRRAGASGGFARQAALEALGIEVLGEVLTFTSTVDADDVPDGEAAA